MLTVKLNDSPFCLKARICLQLKGVAFRRVTLTVGRMRELRRLNPLGKVPVLVDGGVAVADSSRIARHLEERHPEPALIPIGAEARAYANLLEEWAAGIEGDWLTTEARAALKRLRVRAPAE